MVNTKKGIYYCGICEKESYRKNMKDNCLICNSTSEERNNLYRKNLIEMYLNQALQTIKQIEKKWNIAITIKDQQITYDEK